MRIFSEEFLTIIKRSGGVSKIACTQQTTWVLMKNGDLYGTGYAHRGQQSDNTIENNHKVFTFEKRLTNVIKISCSQHTTWAIKKDHTLWGCGEGDHGQQGNGSTDSVSTFTQRLTNVSEVTCVDNATWVIKTDNTLWGCGFGDWGQQGSGSSSDVTTFTQRGSYIVSVVCSDFSTWAIANNGDLFGCGRGDYGQQGNDRTSGSSSFVLRLQNVKQVCCSTNTTWALKTDGTLLGCGYNMYGQQGNGERSGANHVKVFTQRLTDVSKVACSGDTTWAIKTDGTLWGCGYNGRGQQGCIHTSNDYQVLTFTQRLTNVKDVSCSEETTWALKNDGTLWGCGRGDVGQQSNGLSGNSGHVDAFTQRLTNVTYCWGHKYLAWAITGDGRLWGCGQSNYGQQGNGSDWNVLTFQDKTQYLQ